MKNITTIILSLSLLSATVLFSAFKSYQHKEMYFSKPIYISRHTSPWSNSGRITGVVKNPPSNFTVQFFSVSQGKIVNTFKAPGKLYIYMSNFLPPGTYKVTIKAPEYSDGIARKIKVVPGKDCVLNVRFSDRVFTNRQNTPLASMNGKLYSYLLQNNL